MPPHLQRAQMLLQQGRHADAERELGLAMAQDPDDAWTHALLGVCLLNSKKFEEASARGRQAVRLAPDSADIRHLVGRIERDRNKLDDAERLFSEAIALNPYDPRYFA
ncbi:MAG: tetratricopeptide repeat protein, partial [Planctomycetota bacterium]